VVLIGTAVPDAHGVAAAWQFRRRFPSIAIVVVTNRENDEEMFAAICAGAAAYCEQSTAIKTLVDLIRRAAAGAYVINEQMLDRPDVAARVLAQYRALASPGYPLSPLTEREMEILRLAIARMSCAEIGLALGTSTQTVRNYVTAILLKLGGNDRTQAMLETGTDPAAAGGVGAAMKAVGIAGDLFDWFTRAAREALACATDEAYRLGHDHVGTEHLLVGLLSDEGVVAGSVLAERGVDQKRVRRAIALTVGTMTTVRQPANVLLTPRAKESIREAVESARRLGHAEVGTGHLLLGLVAERGGTAVGILECLGCRLEEVERRVTERLIQGASDEPECDDNDEAAAV
jgi:DNA-binding NarL/FixJ family response regulator